MRFERYFAVLAATLMLLSSPLAGQSPPLDQQSVDPSSSYPGWSELQGIGPHSVIARNPIISGDRPDPGVTRIIENGQAAYYLVHTVHNGGDIPLFRSSDLVHWTQVSSGLFQRTGANPITINGRNYCSIWAPELFPLPRSLGFMLSFSATRHSGALGNGCPAYNQNGGVYLAWSPGLSHQFAPTQNTWEPLAAAPSPVHCPALVANELPASPNLASRNCGIRPCDRTIRLDSSVFLDDFTGKYWLAYSWFTGFPPSVSDTEQHGEHIGIIELNPADPFTVRCQKENTPIHAVSPQDKRLLESLEQACPRCSEMLSMTRGLGGVEMVRNNLSWGVAEGASLFRRGAYVYLMFSTNGWNSTHYQVNWVAAPSVEELASSNPRRLVGRYLIPNKGNAYGHGSPVLGPDGINWYYIHHRLRAQQCAEGGSCARDIWISPIEFDSRADGLPDVHIRPRFPSEDEDVMVIIE